MGTKKAEESHTLTLTTVTHMHSNITLIYTATDTANTFVIFPLINIYF